MLTIETTSNNMASLNHVAWRLRAKRGYYMKGSIAPAGSAVCIRCKSKEFKTVLDDFLNYKVPKCTKCGGPPSKLIVRKYIPTNNGKGTLKDYTFDMEGKEIVTISQAIGLIGQLNDMLKDGSFKPEEHDFKSRQRLEFARFSKEYLKWSESRTALPREHENYLSPGSLRSREGLIRLELIPFFKNKMISEIDRFDLKAFSASYLSKFRTRDLALGELRTMLRYAHAELGLIQSVPPFPKISKARQKKVNEIPSREIQIEIINAIDNEMYRTMWIIAATLSKRPSEVRAYKVEDFDVQSRILRTRSHFTKGPTGMGEVLVDGRKSIRESDDLGVLFDKLDDYLYGLLLQYVDGKKPDDFIFNGKIGKFVSRDSMDDAWRKACKKTGHKFRPYDGTKHSTLTDLTMKGVSMERLRAFAGQKNTKVTELYAKIAAINTNDMIDSSVYKHGKDLGSAKNNAAQVLEFKR